MSIDAVIAPSGQGAVEVRGADRASFLNAVVSQEVVALDAGQVAGALLLDSHGAPLAMFDVAVLDDHIVLLTPTADLAAEVEVSLSSRTFLAAATFTVMDVAAWGLRGERARHVVAAAGLEIPTGMAREIEGILAIGREDGVDVIGRPEVVKAFIERLVAAGAEVGSSDVLEQWRIARGIPAWAREVRAPHLPEETGLLPTHVHMQKGCYPGQEAVARMWMLGRPRRHLARVLLVGDAGPGWTYGSGKAGVEVTSATTDGEHRVGLAYVPAEARPGDRYGDATAVIVRDLVGEGLPVPGHDPSVLRRRDRR